MYLYIYSKVKCIYVLYWYLDFREVNMLINKSTNYSQSIWNVTGLNFLLQSSITRKLHRGFAGWTWKRGKKAEEILWGSQTDVWESREMGLFLQADDWNGGKCQFTRIIFWLISL